MDFQLLKLVLSFLYITYSSNSSKDLGFLSCSAALASATKLNEKDEDILYRNVGDKQFTLLIISF